MSKRARNRAVRALAKIATAETELHQAVADMRAAGMSWAEIGQVLGVTRQAAWQRYGREVAA